MLIKHKMSGYSIFSQTKFPDVSDPVYSGVDSVVEGLIHGLRSALGSKMI